MKQYLQLLDDILTKGKMKPTRTGVKAVSLTGYMLEFDMSEDKFPLLTTKKMSLKNVAVELLGFCKGVTDKRWFQERGCHIWDEWCSPSMVPYGTDEETKRKMKEETELGPIYGAQWRNFNRADVDQLRNAVQTMRKDPYNRRVIVMAWNPVQNHLMALPPCHIGFQLLSDGERLDLIWWQRSCDTPLGIPYNIASYGLLLRILAVSIGLKPGKLVGMLSDVHIYENQIDGVKEQLTREPRPCPIMSHEDLRKSALEQTKKSIRDELVHNTSTEVDKPLSFLEEQDLLASWCVRWEPDTVCQLLRGYDPHPAIRFPIAV